jgi:hypothetical protein
MNLKIRKALLILAVPAVVLFSKLGWDRYNRPAEQRGMVGKIGNGEYLDG